MSVLCLFLCESSVILLFCLDFQSRVAGVLGFLRFFFAHTIYRYKYTCTYIGSARTGS